MLSNQDIDLIDLEKISEVDNGDISITSNKWHLEVISTSLSMRLREYISNPYSYEGAFSRLLILMQWSNILGSMTSGSNHSHYFYAEDFLKVINAGKNDTHRLTIKSLNNHFEWIENQYEKLFISKINTKSIQEGLNLGRLEETKIIKVKEN